MQNSLDLTELVAVFHFSLQGFNAKLSRSFERAAEAAGSCELCFVVGTSAVVYPAASIPEIARAAGAFVVEVNPERTSLSDLCDEVLTGKAGEILPMIR